MEINQTKDIVMKINISFNRCYEKYVGQQREYLINEFHSHLKYYDYNDVVKAVDRYIEENERTPKIANIRQELNYLKIKKKYYIDNHNQFKIDDFDKVSKNSLQELFIREYCPVIKMNIFSLDIDSRERIQKKAENVRYKIIEFVNKVWVFISEIDDICNYHVQIVLNNLRGCRLVFNDFMREISHIVDDVEKMNKTDYMKEIKNMFKINKDGVKYEKIL